MLDEDLALFILLQDW